MRARIFTMTLISILCMGLYCIPGEKPQKNPGSATVLLPSSGPKVLPPSEIPIAQIPALFPDTGRYQLEESEKEFLEYTVHLRNERGHYDPEQQKRIALNIADLIEFARADGVEYRDLLNHMSSDFQSNIDIWPMDVLERYKFAASVSIVYATEIKNNDIFISNGIPVQLMIDTITAMHQIRNAAIDEMDRRLVSGELD